MDMKKSILLFILPLILLGACSSNNTFDNTTETNVFIYGHIDMEESKAAHLKTVVLEQIKPKPKDKKDRYIFSGRNNNSFGFVDAKPNAVYEIVRFEGVSSSSSFYSNVTTITTYQYKLPKEHRPKFKTGNIGEFKFVGAFKYKQLEDSYTLEPLKGKEYQAQSLDNLMWLASWSDWEPLFDRELEQLQ